MKIIDATDAVLGRLASRVAKTLLEGEAVVITNADEAVITGKKESIFARYKKYYDRKDRANPTKGPHYPRSPDRILRRAIRGMISHRSKRGKAALRALKVFVGAPTEYGTKAEKYAEALPVSSFVRVYEVSKQLGWKDRRKVSK
ncbi:MAG: 50S ribosomal protein L13 [Candidatus Diapherotrites archaeon]|nr:50S ribosomal protein L13 [Candidatus Diapherotrites archaeon]